MVEGGCVKNPFKDARVISHDITQSLIGHRYEYVRLYQHNAHFKHAIDSFVSGLPLLVETLAAGATLERQKLDMAIENINKAGIPREWN